MKRQSNFEMLRIFAMLGVVFLHYYNPLMGQASVLVEPNSINFFILNFLKVLLFVPLMFLFYFVVISCLKHIKGI